MPPSLDVLEDVVRREYDAQERRADSLDTKAGLVLGFSGLLVSLTPTTLWPPLAVLARLLAGAVLALVVFTFAAPSPKVLGAVRKRDLVDVRYEVLDEMAAMHETLRRSVRRKVWHIRAAVLLLTASLGTIAIGTTVVAVRDWTG